MAWPQSELGTTVELFDGASWLDITDKTRLESAASGGGITITAGRSAEGQDTEHTRVNLTLDNRDGRFSPRNPNSPLFGKIGRNTPLRIKVDEAGGQSVLALSGRDAATTPNVMMVPGHSAFGTTNQVDVRLDAVVPGGWRPDNPGPDGLMTLAARYLAVTGGRCWYLSLAVGGRLRFTWSENGEFATVRSAFSTVPVTPGLGGRLAVRATFDAAARQVVFYTAPTLAGPWVQLGDPRTTIVTSLFSNTTTPVMIGGTEGLSAAPLPGLVYGFEYRTAIDGPVVAAPDIANMQPGQRELLDQFGRTWTLRGTNSQIIDLSARCYVEASSLPQRWDLGEFDKWVPVEAAGILRRMGKGQSPRQSPMRKTLSKQDLAAYLPLEEGSDATRPANASSRFLSTGSVGVEFGASEAPKGAQRAAALQDGAVITTQVDSRTGATKWAVTGFYKMDALPTAGTDWPVLQCYLEGGSGSVFELRWSALGYNMVVKNNKGAVLVEKFGATWSVIDPTQWFCWALQISQVGSQVHVGYVMNQVGLKTFFGGFEGTSFTGTMGRMTRVDVVNPSNEWTGLGVSHLFVNNNGDFIFNNELITASVGYQGELAARRIMRLLNEENIPVVCFGDPDGTMPMGPQGDKTTVELIREAAKVDGGLLLESRGMLGFEYRTRRTLYNQPHLQIPYGHTSAPFEPVDDDDALVNDQTVRRTGGGSARYVKESGPLSTLPPPAGVGVYDSDDEVNTADDERLLDIAGWRVNLGTVDEPRYPQIRFDFSSPPWVADPSLTRAVAQARPGDAMAIVGMPEGMPPDVVRAIGQGYTEKLDAFAWEVVWNATPSAPYEVAVAGTARVAASGSTLEADLSAGGTSALMDHGERNRPWTENPAHFPQDLRIGGEQVTATAIGPAVNDPFTRTVAGNWGTEPVSGLTYQTSGSGGSSASTNGSVGLLTLSGPNQSREVRLDLGIADIDVYVTSTPTFTPAGANPETGIVVRYVDSANLLDLRIFRTTAGAATTAIRQVKGGVETAIGFPAIPGATSTSTIRARVRAIGGLLAVKAWVGATEPEEWNQALEVTHLAAGSLVLRQILGSAATNPFPASVQFDDLRINRPQRIALGARGLNAPARTWPAGTEVEVWQPARAAL